MLERCQECGYETENPAEIHLMDFHWEEDVNDHFLGKLVKAQAYQARPICIDRVECQKRRMIDLSSRASWVFGQKIEIKAQGEGEISFTHADGNIYHIRWDHHGGWIEQETQEN